jgi:hypothetical protein
VEAEFVEGSTADVRMAACSPGRWPAALEGRWTGAARGRVRLALSALSLLLQARLCVSCYRPSVAVWSLIGARA